MEPVYKDIEINMDVKLYENQKTIIKFTCMLFKHQVNICALFVKIKTGKANLCFVLIFYGTSHGTRELSLVV